MWGHRGRGGRLLNLEAIREVEPGDGHHRPFGESLSRSEALLVSFSPPALLLRSATFLAGLGLGVNSRTAQRGLAFRLFPRGPAAFGQHPSQFRLHPTLGFRF